MAPGVHPAGMTLLATSCLPELDVRRMDKGACKADPALNFQTAPHDGCMDAHNAPAPVCMRSTAERSPSPFTYLMSTAKYSGFEPASTTKVSFTPGQLHGTLYVIKDSVWRGYWNSATSAVYASYMVEDKFLPGVLDLEDAGVAQLVGLAGVRHGAECRSAHVEVARLVEARTARAFIGDDDGHWVAGARAIAGAFDLCANVDLFPTT